ncbi:MAG: glycosyltransferase family 2 protein [Cyclobacteriaceae bacterium]
MPVKISGVIITFNEEENIERCIQSIIDVVDEVLVVDSFSTDKTREICEKLKVKFIENPFAGHIEQKNVAVQKAKNDIILSLDADEALTEGTKTEILKVKDNWVHDAYYVNRLTNYCGKWIRHCGWYPDKKIRLFDRKMASWGGENPHDRVVVKKGAKVGSIKGDLLHYSFPTIHDHAKTANHFSEIAAQEAIKKGKNVSLIIHVLLNPWFTFIKKYFFQLGFLDGYHGFVICVLSAHSNFLKYNKIRMLTKYENSHQQNR